MPQLQIFIQANINMEKKPAKDDHIWLVVVL